MNTVTSRANLAKPAVRPALPARLMLSGPAGSGKTWTALTIARILVGPDGRIVLIDTETDSALTYADEHVFEHLPWAPPYDPRELAATVRDLSEPGTCIIVDSHSHFWQGEGGTLDIADGKFGGWKEATPAQDEMVSAMLRSKAHIISCVREKQAYAATEVVEGGRKKQVIEKLGLQPIQREGLDYEFNVAASIDMHHNLAVHKTRCRRLAGRSYRANHSDELAIAYAEWLAGGHPVVSKAQADGLRARTLALPGKDERSPLRAACIAEFKDTFGSADNLLVEDLAEAEAMIARYEAQVAAPAAHDVAVANLDEAIAEVLAVGAAMNVGPEDEPGYDDTDLAREP